MKHIPNLFTLLNLILGCTAIVLVLQTGETIVVLEDGGATQVTLPERMAQGGLLLFAAALVDFLDGFLARLLKAPSEMGKQLDSLSDVVSFGVAPGVILWQLLRIGFAQEPGGLDTSIALLLPAFLVPAAAAWRLARFNLLDDPSTYFRGLPSPAAGLVVASFPLIIWNGYFGLQTLFITPLFLYAAILLLGGLMISRLPFIALKFRSFGLKENAPAWFLLLAGVLGAVFLGWLAVPVIFLVYFLVSLLVRPHRTAAVPVRE